MKYLRLECIELLKVMFRMTTVVWLKKLSKEKDTMGTSWSEYCGLFGLATHG